MKKEIAGWDDNRAVILVNIEDVPASAKIVPLGELYTIKRNGTYKFWQYLMGNLLRPGVDFQDNLLYYDLINGNHDFLRELRSSS